MTSIRGRLDSGILMKCDVEFFRLNRGLVPMCCCKIQLRNYRTFRKLKEPLYQCDQLEKPLPMKDFKPFCLKCQEYIEKKLKEIDIESLY